MNKIHGINLTAAHFRSGYATVPYMLQKDNKKSNIKDGDKKSMNALKWAGIIAAGALAVGGTVHSIKKGQMPKYERLTDEAGKTVQKVGGKVLTYDKGVAMLDGKKAEGILKFTTNNGVTLTYNNGILQNSIKTGKNGFKKLYDKKGLLEKMTTIGTDGKKDIIKHIHNKKTGKILKIKNKLKGDTIFKYSDNKKLIEATRNGEKLTSLANL